MRLIDSHCHLNYAGLAEHQDEVLANARARGIAGFLNISTRQSEWDEVIGAAERKADVWATVGVHPHEADAHPDLGAAALVEAAAHPRVIAIGECGLDYYYDKSDRAAQRERFAAHIDAARETGLPLVVHTRDAEEDTAEILDREVGKGASPACSIASPAAPTSPGKALDLGFYISHLGHRHLQECQGPAGGRQDDPAGSAAGRNRFALPRAGAAPRQDLRAGLRRRHRRLPRRPARRAARRAGRSDHRQFLQTVRQSRRVKVRILGCGTSSGVPRIGNDWGDCDPDEPRNRRPRVLDPGRKRWRAAAGRLRPRLARAAAGGGGRPTSTGDLDPRPCRPLPRHRRSAAGCQHAGPSGAASRPRRDAATA